MTKKEEFKNWKEDSEMVWKSYGIDIKVINKKLNSMKTIFSVFGFISILILIIGFYGLSVGALEVSTPSNSSNLTIDSNILTIKILHEIKFSPELEDYINKNIPSAWYEIKGVID